MTNEDKLILYDNIERIKNIFLVKDQTYGYYLETPYYDGISRVRVFRTSVTMNLEELQIYRDIIKDILEIE